MGILINNYNTESDSFLWMMNHTMSYKMCSATFEAISDEDFDHQHKMREKSM